MAENQPIPMSHNKNPKNPTNLSHSRSISTIPNHHKTIGFMPKFLLKTFHRRKRSVSNSTIINGNKNIKDPTTKNNQLLQLIPVPKRVTAMMSFMFKKDKQLDQEQCKNPKQVSNKSMLKEVPSRLASTSKDSKLGAGIDSSVDELSRPKSDKNRENVEVKGGFKMKKMMKIRSREKERFELCKKKILMGEKCRPLHGSLHYDKNGVLVAEGFHDC
ncbi:unnamed protein product [Amaranthus hypochondriacus]